MEDEATKLARETVYSREFWLDQLPAINALASMGVGRQELILFVARGLIHPTTALRVLNQFVTDPDARIF